MSATDWAKGPLLGELQRATEAGRSATAEELKAAVGIGAGDLETVMDELREEGLATQIAPDEWQWIREEDRRAAAAPGPAAAPAPEPDAPNGLSLAAAEAQGRAAAASADPPPPPAAPAPAPQSRVAITTAMLDALDDEALGKLVRAGVTGAGQAEFAFVVLP